MILQNINLESLTKLLTPHMGKAAWPGLTDPQVKERARSYAKESGLWDRITATLDPNRAIAVYKRSAFREYARTGSRVTENDTLNAQLAEMHLASTALWLDHPAASVDYLQDIIWALCETTWWKLSAHEKLHIDLVSALYARELAEFSFIFADQFEPEVKQRISQAIATQVFDIAFDYKRADWWQTADNNWNSVCNGNLITAALYEIKDPSQLAAFIHPVCRRLDYALGYYTEDGGCVEGVGYWEYGFESFVNAAISLFERTGGAVNLMDDEKVARICRFPVAGFLRAPTRASFADGGHGWLLADTALKINRLVPVPELFQFVKSTDNGLLEMDDIRSLALYNGEKPQPHVDCTDCLLPDLGYAKVNAAENDVVLAAVAGRNDVSHNHNDLGSYLLLKNGVIVLTDPGTPVYSSKTFGPHRYDMLVCNSKGHSVPVINGHYQEEGGQYFGTIAAEGLNSKGSKTVSIDLSHGYPDPTLSKFVRQFVVEKEGVVRMLDQFEFSNAPTALEEAFLSFEPVEVCGEALKVGTGTSCVTITTQTPGSFSVETFSPEEHEGRDLRPLHRARFVPDKLSNQVRLEFTIR